MSGIRTTTQEQLYTTLSENEALMELVEGVFDFIPDNQPWPYVKINTIDWTPFDTFDSNGFNASVQIDVWDRPGTRGTATTLAIQEAVYNALHKVYFDLGDDAVVISARFDFSQIIVDPDNVTYHGIQRFKLIISGG